MKQHEAVILTLEQLGGQATLAELYQHVMRIKECEWKTRTPFASIRRIVQTRPEIFKVRPGLWALRSQQKALGLKEQDRSEHDRVNSHSYYQGLIASIGNLRGYGTFIPNQDKNRLFVNRPLSSIRSLDSLPRFSHDSILSRCETVDVIWFNQRQLPHSFFEVEHSTDMQNSLLKFFDLRDFSSRMVIVADANRQREFQSKLAFEAFREIKPRVAFLSYESLAKDYEHETAKAGDFTI